MAGLNQESDPEMPCAPSSHGHCSRRWGAHASDPPLGASTGWPTTPVPAAAARTRQAPVRKRGHRAGQAIAQAPQLSLSTLASCPGNHSLQPSLGPPRSTQNTGKYNPHVSFNHGYTVASLHCQIFSISNQTRRQNSPGVNFKCIMYGRNGGRLRMSYDYSSPLPYYRNQNPPRLW